MATFAAQVTVAVKTAQQFSQLARWAAQLQSIQQLGARLNRLTTVPEIASAIATELRVLINYDNIRVYRLDGEDLNAVALNATDALYLDETPEDVRSRLGQEITGWVAEHGIAQNLPNTTIDPRTVDIPGSDIFDKSMLLAPLLYEARVLGVIALSTHGLNQFEDDDLRLLESTRASRPRPWRTPMPPTSFGRNRSGSSASSEASANCSSSRSPSCRPWIRGGPRPDRRSPWAARSL